jgi:hypothetical protein
VNDGPTAIDSRATLRLSGKAGPILEETVATLAGG